MSDLMHNKKRSRGGVARSKKLSPAQRSAIARRAANERWNPSIPEVEYGSKDRPVHLGHLQIECYVLSGGKRVFARRGMTEALGISSRGGELQRLVEQADLRKFLSDEAKKTLTNPIEFRPPGGGRSAFGYPVEFLVDLCNAVLDSHSKDKLPRHFDMTRIRAQVILRAVAKLGIIALVDEVTGYDASRKETLQALLDRLLRAELAEWSKRFPDEFYEQIFRLRNWVWKGRKSNPPGVVAYYTKDLVYARLAPGILPELEKRNPIGASGRRSAKHHQYLTDEFGHPKLQVHLHMVVGLMRAATNWKHLMELMDRALPRLPENLTLPLLEWDDSPAE